MTEKESKSPSEEEIIDRLERSFVEKNRKFGEISEKSFILRQTLKNREGESLEDDRRKIRNLVEQREALKRQKEKAATAKFYEYEFWSYYLSRNSELFTNLLMDTNCLLLTYPFNTIKTRIQSKHTYEDVAFFLKNKVEHQRKI